MEEELNYSTVVFKNAGTRPKETKEDSSIYSTVKAEKPVNTPPNAEAETAAHSQHVRLLAVCFGLLCVLSLVSVGVIIHFKVKMDEQETNFKATINSLTAENQQLNWTLGVILNFDTFPVNEYCPQKKCQQCQTGWIQFQQKCYLFYENPAPWKTWPQSRQFCQNISADLVVIDNLQEQEFVTNNTKFYYDKWHGYFLGLSQTADKNWVWVDVHNDTLQYWVKDKLSTTGIYAMLLPDRTVTANWNRSDHTMQNKFICEREALIWSN